MLKNLIQMDLINKWAPCGTCNPNSEIKFKTSMLKWSFCEYSDVYTLVKWRITVVGEEAATKIRQGDWKENQVVFKNYAPLTDCIIKVNNTLVDNAKDLDFIILIYSDNYSKISERLYQFCRDEVNDSLRDCK